MYTTCRKPTLKLNNTIYTGEISFTLFRLFGIWKPIKWKSPWKTRLYRLYSLSMITLYFTFILSIILYFIKVPQQPEIFIENFFYFFCILATFIKQLSLMFKQKTVMEAKEKFLNKLCEPEDLDESELLQRSSNISRFKNRKMNFLSFH